MFLKTSQLNVLRFLEHRNYKIFFNLINKFSFTGKVQSALSHGAASF